MALFKCAKNNGNDIVKAEPSDREKGGKKYTLRNGVELYFGPGQELVPCTNDEKCLRRCTGDGWAWMHKMDRTRIPGVIQAENA
jgi:hypothetical protein